MSGEEKILTLSNLESLDVIVPDETEIALVKAFEGDKNTLANAERFIYEVQSVPGLKFRVKAFKFLKV